MSSIPLTHAYGDKNYFLAAMFKGLLDNQLIVVHVNPLDQQEIRSLYEFTDDKVVFDWVLAEHTNTEASDEPTGSAT